MVEKEDYQRLRQTVTNLLVRIEENQQIQARFHDFEFKLLACRRISELLEQLIINAKTHFDIAAVSLTLHDPDYAIAGLLENLDISAYSDFVQLRHSADFFSALYHNSYQVKLGELDMLTATRLFPKVEGVGSAALLPLMRQDRIIGSLHLASHSKQRYSADKGVNFMWHLALMVAICLENCVALEQLQRQGQEDILTKVRNRRCFEEQFSKELDRAARQHEPLSCMFVDIDHFKQINDSYGHPVGDQCLREVAKQISGELRKTDLLARYGGEEFVGLLPRCHQDEAEIIAERVRDAVANNPLLLGENNHIPLTVSIGMSTWEPGPQRVEDLSGLGESLLSTADAAMYSAKQSGRNRVEKKSFIPCVATEIAPSV